LDRDCLIDLEIDRAAGPLRAEGSLNAFGINLNPRTTGAGGMEKREAVLKRPFSRRPDPQ